MGEQVAEPLRKFASSRICKVSGFSTELVEFHSEEPVLHILFIPGNPGIVSFYKKFIEAMYENFEGRASITGIGHVSHTKKTCVTRRTFSLQDQINHKVDFIKQELQDTKIPVIMVKLTVALYPFLTRNKGSFKQDFIGFISRSSILSAAVSTLSYSLGLLPTRVKSFLVRRSLGPSWTSSAVDIIATNLLEYQTMRSILFMTLTEFEELAEDPDWSFIRSKQGEIAILFGDDDHWGPLTLLEEISKQAPDVHLAVEKEGHTHAFCCTDAGSVWVADHVASLIKIRILSAET
ncbi:alpha/beta-Hydrolases superfamily protein isoform X2 [Wolffia australiana]